MHKKQSTTHLDEKGSLIVPHIPHHTHFPQLPVWHLPNLELKLLKLRLQLESIFARLAKINRTHAAIATAATLTTALGGYIYQFTRPTNLQMNYASNSICSDSLIAFPGLNSSSNNSAAYDISYKRPISVAGFALFSRSLCITPNSLPTANESQTANIAFLGAGFLSKDITVSNESYPEIINAPDTDKKLFIHRPLSFTVSSPDKVFDYKLSGNDQSVDCDFSTDLLLNCDVSQLKLKQSSKYKIQLDRYFNGSLADSPFSTTLTTTDAVKVVSTSINEGAHVYDKPTQVVITFNKEIDRLEGVNLATAAGNIATTYKINGKQVTISFADELPRNARFTLGFDQAYAVDDAILEKKFVLNFTTSGGPRVLGTNLSLYGFDQNGAISVTFDIATKNHAELASQFVLTSGGKVIPSTVSVTGRTATISPSGSLPWCSAFKLQVPNGLVSVHGVPNGSGGSYDGKTICYTTHVVGYSAQGRAIIGYKFGTGGENIVFVGGTHGDESSSTNILYSWIDVLDQEIANIPSNRSVYVVPVINPDGLAIGGRVNANGVDLNRNFPANNWKKDVIMPSGELNVNGGGTAALSEPESSAIANYVLGLTPKLVLTYHATGGLAISNQSGSSTSLAHHYAGLTGYTGLANHEIAGIFSHDITGAFEDWLHDKHGIPAILIELWSYGGNEINGHKAAMWSMVKH